MWSITRPSPWARWWKTPRTKPAPNTAFHNARRSLLRRAFSLFGPRPFPDPASALQRHMRQQVSAPLGGDLSLSAWSADRDEASPLWDAVRINGCRGGLGRPRGNPSTPGVGFDLWSFRRRGKQPLQGKRRASTGHPYRARCDSEDVGATCGRPLELLPTTEPRRAGTARPYRMQSRMGM